MSAVLAVLLAACSAVPPPQSASGITRVYIVERGESLSQIARDLRVDFRALAAANGLAPPYTIHPGQRLRLPGSGRTPVATAPPRPAVTTPPAQQPAPSYAPVVQPTPIGPAPNFAWPSDGALASGFGLPFNGRANDGIELSIHPGQRILAAAGGTVLFAGPEPRFGQLVVIDHGNGWASAYGFAGQVTVTQGEVVAYRERIGVGGSAGRMLHFEIRRDNQPRDPVPFLPPRF